MPVHYCPFINTLLEGTVEHDDGFVRRLTTPFSIRSRRGGYVITTKSNVMLTPNGEIRGTKKAAVREFGNSVRGWGSHLMNGETTHHLVRVDHDSVSIIVHLQRPELIASSIICLDEDGHTRAFILNLLEERQIKHLALCDDEALMRRAHEILAGPHYCLTQNGVRRVYYECSKTELLAMPAMSDIKDLKTLYASDEKGEVERILSTLGGARHFLNQLPTMDAHYVRFLRSVIHPTCGGGSDEMARGQVKQSLEAQC